MSRFGLKHKHTFLTKIVDSDILFARCHISPPPAILPPSHNTGVTSVHRLKATVALAYPNYIFTLPTQLIKRKTKTHLHTGLYVQTYS